MRISLPSPPKKRSLLLVPVIRSSPSLVKKAMPFCDETDKTYEYYLGEYAVFVLNNPQAARAHYIKAIKQLPQNSRFYAMSCFALSGSYGNEGNTEKQEEFLLLSSIADIENCTMENFALQNLDLHS